VFLDLEDAVARAAHATGVEARGAVMLGDEMIDEASHKMARAIVARGRAAGMSART
jgi:citrate lyase subunit beta/citryl-CoA lyase